MCIRDRGNLTRLLAGLDIPSDQVETESEPGTHLSASGAYEMCIRDRAFAVAAEQPEKDNPLRTAEMTLEDDYGMIDGVINNGRRGEESEKAQMCIRDRVDEV